MLTLESITIKKNYKTIINNLSLSILPYSFICLNGKNGAGKSSILKAISTLLPIHKGKIYYNKINIKLCINEYLDLIQYIPDNSYFNEEFTVLENFMFWGELNDNLCTLEAAIKIFSLEKYLKEPIFKLSQGWKKKAQLGLLLFKNAPIWLLDEPFANLDSNGEEALINLISVKCNHGGTVIVTSPNALNYPNCLNININDFSKVL